MTRRKVRHFTDKTRRCRMRGSHADAMDLVGYLMDRGGRTMDSAEQIAINLGWERRVGSARVTDMARFHIARNHVKDGRDKDERQCTGYSIHYRTSGKETVWALIDPFGSLKDRLDAARQELKGDLQQQVTIRTINGRRMQTAEAMADWCLKSSPVDGLGHRLMLEYIMELRKFGAISDQLIAEINQWLAGSHPQNPGPATGLSLFEE